jgi:hypothetical protein
MWKTPLEIPQAQTKGMKQLKKQEWRKRHE